MKRVKKNGCTFARDGDRVTVSDADGGMAEFSLSDFLLALPELEEPEAAPDPTPPTPWRPVTLADLKNGAECRYRAGVERGGEVKWKGKWQAGTLAVEKREYDVPRSHRDQTAFWKKGEVASVSIAGRHDLTEHPPDELGEGGTFYADGGDCQYLLQIEVPGHA